MEKVHIINSFETVSEHFTMYEYWKPFFGSHGDFDTPKELIEGVEFLRCWFNIPMIITSVYRPSGAIQDVHSDGLAADLNAMDVSMRIQILEQFEAEVIHYIKGLRSDLIEGLRKIGITGIGLEEGCCIHIDCRTYKTTRTDKYGDFQVFQYQTDGHGVVLINKSL